MTSRANGGCVPPVLASGRPALRGRHPCADGAGARAELAARCALRSDTPLRVSSRSALRAPPPPLRFLPPLNAIPDGTQPPFACEGLAVGTNSRHSLFCESLALAGRRYPPMPAASAAVG